LALASGAVDKERIIFIFFRIYVTTYIRIGVCTKAPAWYPTCAPYRVGALTGAGQGTPRFARRASLCFALNGDYACAPLIGRSRCARPRLWLKLRLADVLRLANAEYRCKARPRPRRYAIRNSPCGLRQQGTCPNGQPSESNNVFPLETLRLCCYLRLAPHTALRQ